MNSIPASEFVNSIPGVIAPEGNPLSLNAVLVDNSGDTTIPLGTVFPFGSLEEVGDWYGLGSPQYAFAQVYFGGFTGCTALPSVLWATQYNTAAASAYLRGGPLSISLTALQAFNATLTLTVNGTTETTASINLSAATSFSDAATIISAALTTATLAAACTWNALLEEFVITSTTTGGGSTMSFGSGGLATDLNLTSALGAVLSQGATTATAATVMNAVVAATTNWASFTYLDEPDLAIKLAFAAWVNNPGTNLQERFEFFGWDSDATALAPDATDSFGYQVKALAYNGVTPIWNPSGLIGAFACGTVASINFEETNGRITFAYKGQSGLVPDITELSQYQNLVANGYNAYVSIATATEQFTNFQPGQTVGEWNWIDPYINQIYMNADFQLAFLTFLTQIKSNPYNAIGYGNLRQVAKGPINDALTFGSIQPGVELSPSQIVAVNTAAGQKIDTVLTNLGYYLQILPANPSVRSARGTPPMTFWYTDGGSIQNITLNSIDVE
jgi:Protein of unknown function (DUF3383)